MEPSESSMPPMATENESSLIRSTDLMIGWDDVLPTASTQSMPNSPARRSYTPQFSTASTLILSRIKHEHAAPSSPGATVSETKPQPHGENRNDTTSIGQSGDVSETLSMPVPQNQQSLSAAARIDAAGSVNLGLKRKREHENGNGNIIVDFMQDTISFPVPTSTTASASSMPMPVATQLRSDSMKTCVKCEQGTSFPHNFLIACSKCTKSWHQKCMSPVMMDESVTTSILVCSACSKLEKNHAGVDSMGQSQEIATKIEALRKKNLSSLPEGVLPAKIESVGFHAGQASDAALTEYFYGKKRTELLNVLSFCDQLKPQLLVDILVSVTRKHPDLPIFDSPNWNTKGSNHSQNKSRHGQTAKSASRPRHGHTILDPKIKHKKKFSKKILKMEAIAPEQGQAIEEIGDFLPPTWPKAGQGLYAKLLPEDKDRSFLLDDNDEEAFSQFEVDRFGKQLAIRVFA